MPDYPALSLAIIGVVAMLCQWLAWRVRLPAILFLLLAGILLGPTSGWLQPDALFGDLLFPFISLGVAVILFEGSLTLRFEEIRGLESVVRRMVSIGMLVTWVITSLATRWLLELPWELAVLFGAIMVVTGPTVIVPMLRSVRPVQSVANILRWEGIVIDPIGALLAVVVFSFIISGLNSDAFGHTLLIFSQSLLIGLLLGGGSGWLIGTALKRYWIPEYLHNVSVLSLLFGVFALSNHLVHESGLLSVTLMGVWLANMKGVHIDEILDFKESLSLFLISGLFIILAARVDFAQVQAIGWPALWIFLIIQFIARPLKVLVSTTGSNLSWRERALLGWIAPRGIVAAAVTALFSIRLEQFGYADAPLLVPLAFLVIIGTVVLQSATARPIALWLKVTAPEPHGFLILGANPVARSIAKVIQGHGLKVLLVDNIWENIRAANMQGLPTYYGSIASEHAELHMDLSGIGRLLALSPVRDNNALASLRFRTEFGNQNVFTLLGEAPSSTVRNQSTRPPVGHIAFTEKTNYLHLSEMLAKGARVHTTGLTESFDFDDYYRKYYMRAVFLFAIDPKQNVHIFSDAREVEPKAGWEIVALILDKLQEEPRKTIQGVKK